MDDISPGDKDLMKLTLHSPHKINPFLPSIKPTYERCSDDNSPLLLGLGCYGVALARVPQKEDVLLEPWNWEGTRPVEGVASSQRWAWHVAGS